MISSKRRTGAAAAAAVSILRSALVLAVVVALSSSTGARAFDVAPSWSSSSRTATRTSARFAVASSSSRWTGSTTTVDAPTKERTKEATQRQRRSSRRDVNEELNDDDNVDYPDLEYLIDSQESREMDDPFHILLLGSTFDKPKISVSYVATSLEYVLSMPTDEAKELSSFAKESGMSCLGTWPREECLELGKQLQRRDLICRVVPFCEGGQRGWQAKDASASSSSSGSSSSSSWY